MFRRSKFSLLALSLAVVLVLCGSASAKSLFLIANINATPTPVDAYEIKSDGTVLFQTQYGVPNLGGGAVGIAIASGNDKAVPPIDPTLFITYEFANNIQLLNARTMTNLGSTTAPGASNLAGIVFDESKKLLYTMDRTTNQLYSYQWNAVSKTLTLVSGAPFSLTNLGGQGAWGIGLDLAKDLLYVANLTNAIPYYSTTDWSYKGQVVMPGTAINVTVDPIRRFLYSGAGDFPGGHGPFTPNDYLDQLNLTTGAKKRVLIQTGVGLRGVSVDADTGMVYLSTGNEAESVHDLRVYTSALALKQNAGSPQGASGLTGLVVGSPFNPLNLKKTGTPATVNPGANITYTLSFDNKKNTKPVTKVVITDPLPANTTFVSATTPGTYNPTTRTVTWNIGTVPAGAGTRSFSLVVKVSPTITAKSILNRPRISSAETPSSTVDCTTNVNVTTFKLTFPLRGYTSTTAPCQAVLDHSVFSVSPIKWYVKDGKVTAFDGETGLKTYGSRSLDIYDCCVGYKNSSGLPFLQGKLNYKGGVYLYFDGHAGYDYAVPTGSIVQASGPGKLYIANSDLVNGGGWSVYKTCYLSHGNGFYSWYLYVNLDSTLLAMIKTNGYASVTRGQTIGRTSGAYLHFDVRQGGIGPSNVVDPYKAQLWQ